MLSPRAFGRFSLLVCFATASLARAEQPSIPLRLQAGLMAKLAGYDRNMRIRAGDRVRVAMLIKPGDADSVRVGVEMSHALGEITEIAGLPHEELSIAYTTAEILPETCTARRIAILYVTPGFDGDALKISQALQGTDEDTRALGADRGVPCPRRGHRLLGVHCRRHVSPAAPFRRRSQRRERRYHGT
jgi:hypothetical protein